MRKKPLNRYSLKKIAELNAEAPIRVQLCLRAGGEPKEAAETIYINGTKHTINRIRCYRGICECGCNEFAPILHPHEKRFRSKCGKLSLENSIMVKVRHHAVLQNNLPKWSKGDG